MADFDQESERILFLRDYFVSKSINSICLITLDSKHQTYADKLLRLLNNVNSKIKIIQIFSLNDLKENIQSEEIHLITQLGFLEIEKVDLLKNV